MRRSRLRSFLIAVVLWSGVALGHLDDYLPPELNTPDEQAIFLGFLSREIPGLFSEATEYDVDVLKFLTDQRTSINHLHQQADFEPALRKRGGLVEIEVYREVKAKVPSTTFVDPSLPTYLEGSYLEQIQSDPAKAFTKVSERLKERFEEYKDTFGELRLKSAVQGLLALLPKHVSQQLYRLKTADQVDRLEELETQVGEVLADFRFADVGMSARPAHEFLEFLGEASDKAGKIRRYVLFAAIALLESHSPTFSSFDGDTRRWLASRLDTLIRDKQLTSMVAELPFVPAEIAQDLIRDYTAKVEGQTLPEKHPVLTLKEAPGYLATLRGFVGVDCSTQYSFPYALLPAERTFFIMGPGGETLGYVMLTTLHSDRKPALYLHDISGPRLTPKMVEAMVVGFQSAFPEHRLILPTPEISLRNINFKHVRAVIDQFASEWATPASLTYLDARLRSSLQTIHGLKLDHRYDTPEVNAAGLALVGISHSWKVDVRRAEWPAVAKQSLSPNEMALLALEIDFPEWSSFAKSTLQSALALTEAPNAIASQRRTVALRIATMALQGQGAHLLTHAAAVFGNAQQLPADAYLDNVTARLKQFRLELSDVLKGHAHLLFEGILNSPDPFTAKHPEAATLALQALKAMLIHREQPQYAMKAVGAWLPALNANENFHGMVQQLVRDRAESLKTLREIIQVGFQPSILEPSLAKLQEIEMNSDDSRARLHADTLLNLVSKHIGNEKVSCIRALLKQSSESKEVE